MPVTAVPGPSAVLTALAVSGLPVDRFCFEGFLPRKAGERARRLAGAGRARSARWSSSRRRTAPRRRWPRWPRRCGDDRAAAVCRELTKTHEEVRRGPLAELVAWAGRGRPRRGDDRGRRAPPAGPTWPATRTACSPRWPTLEAAGTPPQGGDRRGRPARRGAQARGLQPGPRRSHDECADHVVRPRRPGLRRPRRGAGSTASPWCCCTASPSGRRTLGRRRAAAARRGAAHPRAGPARLLAGRPARAPARLPDDQLVADVVALIEAVGRPVHLVGHDWGAAVGLAGRRRAAPTWSAR